jgi:hypothetical protein
MIIVDNFIKDKTFLDSIANDKKFFDNNGQYYWYDGWWVEEPNTLKKKLIEKIWGHNSPYHDVSVCGFEYWTGQLGPQITHQELPAHIDKDEAEYEKTGKHITPTIGTVFYPVPMDIEGGELVIYSEGERAPEIVKPVFNRLVIFPAGQHRHKVNPVNQGVRSAIAINLWKKKPSGEFLKEPIQFM